MWSDGFYGDWYINPTINYFQIEKYGRGMVIRELLEAFVYIGNSKWNCKEILVDIKEGYRILETKQVLRI